MPVSHMLEQFVEANLRMKCTCSKGPLIPHPPATCTFAFDWLPVGGTIILNAPRATLQCTVQLPAGSGTTKMRLDGFEQAET